MQPNVDLLNRTLAYIEEHPEQWNQHDWRCETGLCFAGTAAELAGGRWLTTSDHFFGNHLLVAEPDDYTSPDVVIDDATAYALTDLTGDVVRASQRAQRLLGLDEATADRLFYGGNKIEDLRRIVGELTDGAA